MKLTWHKFATNVAIAVQFLTWPIGRIHSAQPFSRCDSLLPLAIARLTMGSPVAAPVGGGRRSMIMVSISLATSFHARNGVDSIFAW
jgi:hypothetical protein